MNNCEQHSFMPELTKNRPNCKTTAITSHRHNCSSKNWRPACTGSIQRGSPHGQDFALRTTVADQHHGHFTGLLIHLCHQPQLIRPARQTFHIELAKRTVRRCLGRLIIFPALKPPCGIHPRTLIRHLDICSPTRAVPRFQPSTLNSQLLE